LACLVRSAPRRWAAIETMTSITKQLFADAEAITKGLGELLGEDRPLRDVNDDGGIVVLGQSFAFDDLSLGQQRLQSKLLRDEEHFFDMARVLLPRQPASVLRDLNQDRKCVWDATAQTHLSWHSTTGEALAAATKALGRTNDAISRLYDPLEGSDLLVPDTNALIARPVLTNWAVESLRRFEVVLTPTVLSELDVLKVEHRNPDVREKAKKVIGQLKEFRRRGSLSDGVTLVGQRSSLRTLALEPDLTTSLPWLDASVPDDRMLASVVEVIRNFPRSRVQLVTGDINLQNKADFARVPVLEIENITAINRES
jgi:hypothetical protein